MHKSIKAALLSAFVFPGAGHFFLKKYIAGTLLAAASCAALYLVGSHAVAQAQQIAEMIIRGEVAPEDAAIMELVSRQAAGSETRLLHFASTVLTVAWLAGIVDSYRVGRRPENDAVGS